MGNIYGRFADQSPDVLSQITVTAANNQLALQTALPENDFLRATSAAFASQAVTRNLSNPVPAVTIVGQNTVGAAVGRVGQAGTPSDPNGGDDNRLPDQSPFKQNVDSGDPIDPAFVQNIRTE